MPDNLQQKYIELDINHIRKDLDDDEIDEIVKEIKDEFGEIVQSGIHTYGETIHIFVERKNYKDLRAKVYIFKLFSKNEG